MKKYLQNIIIPVLWEVICLIGFIILPEWLTYINAIFYIGLILYFRRDFKANLFVKHLKSGKKFRKSVGLTVLGVIIGFMFSILLCNVIFKGIDDGMFKLRTNGWFEIFLFAISTILMPPLAEELFFRKNLINDSSKTALIITSIISVLLYTAEHSLNWLGILEMACIALPFTLSYIKTKNVYVVVTAHFIVNIAGNLPTVIIAIIDQAV